MESELSGIFRVKLVTKNIACGSPGTQFIHMRVKMHHSTGVLRTLLYCKLTTWFLCIVKHWLQKV